MSNKFSRRDFLKVALASAGGMGLVACGAKATEVAAPAVTEAVKEAATVAAAPAAGDTIRIGVIQPLSGPATLQGTMEKYAYDYAAGMINQAGGIEIHGRQADRIGLGDHQNKQDLAVNENRASYPAGKSSRHGRHLDFRHRYERHHCFRTSPGALRHRRPRRRQRNRGGLKWLFRVGILGTNYGTTFGDFVKYANEELNAGLKKMAFVYPDTEAARSFSGACVDRGECRRSRSCLQRSLPG